MLNVERIGIDGPGRRVSRGHLMQQPIELSAQGYLNLKGYKEFDNANRPDGWNAWVTFVLSPAEQTPSASSRHMRSM